MSDDEKAALLRELREEQTSRHDRELAILREQVAEMDRECQQTRERLSQTEAKVAVLELTQRIVHLLVFGILTSVAAGVVALLIPK